MTKQRLIETKRLIEALYGDPDFDIDKSLKYLANYLHDVDNAKRLEQITKESVGG